MHPTGARPSVDGMMKSFYAAATWLALGLAAGVFYREYTKLTGNLGVDTELSLMHTHILITVGLIALFMAIREGIGERQERLDARRARLQSARGQTPAEG